MKGRLVLGWNDEGKTNEKEGHVQCLVRNQKDDVLKLPKLKRPIQQRFLLPFHILNTEMLDGRRVVCDEDDMGYT